ncbi:hypothetical protein MKK82_33785, partial [Methylobacterium sp. E-046]|nr:hypothetical protein [Methylobacterium sp. E-046]
MRLATLVFALCIVRPGAVLAQPDPTAAPDPARLQVARETVAQMTGDRAATLRSMAAPMVGMMQQIGIKEAEKAQVLVQE